MRDGIGGTAKGHGSGHGIVYAGLGDDGFGSQIFPNHFHNAFAGFSRHARMRGIRGRNGRSARQGEAHGFHGQHHGRRRACCHAGAETARNAAFHIFPLRFGDVPGAQFGVIFPDITARTQRLAAPGTAQHWAGGHENAGQACGDRTHHQARRRFVAATQQHQPIARLAAGQFFRFHRQKVTIEHGRRLLILFRHGMRGQFHGKAAGLPDAALHFLGPRAEMEMAGAELRPGIDDPDHRLAAKIRFRIAGLQHAGPVAEGADIIHAKPAMAAEFFGFLARHGTFLCFFRRYFAIQWLAWPFPGRFRIDGEAFLRSGLTIQTEEQGGRTARLEETSCPCSQNPVAVACLAPWPLPRFR